jgi:hypothetical protein
MHTYIRSKPASASHTLRKYAHAYLQHMHTYKACEFIAQVALQYAFVYLSSAGFAIISSDHVRRKCMHMIYM